MKTNPNEPATGYGFCTADGGNVAEYGGLTKREYFAGLAMQGILSAQTMMRSNGADNLIYSQELPIATEAVALADALINELNKEESK